MDKRIDQGQAIKGFEDRAAIRIARIAALEDEVSELQLRLAREGSSSADQIASMKGWSKSKALNQLKMILARLLHGVLGVVLVSWKANRATSLIDAGSADGDTLRRELFEARTEAAHLRSTTAELEKEVRKSELRVEDLQEDVTRLTGDRDSQRTRVSELEAALAEMQASHIASMAMNGKSQAISRLRLALARIAKGEAGMRIVCWRTKQKDSEAHALARRVGQAGLELEAMNRKAKEDMDNLKGWSKNKALNQLKMILAR